MSLLSITSDSPESHRIPADLHDAADVALAIQVEKMRVAEALGARDVVVQRLVDAYVSIRQKSEMISKLQNENNELEMKTLRFGTLTPTPLSQGRNRKGEEDEVDRLNGFIRDLHEEIRLLKSVKHTVRESEDPPCYDTLRTLPSYRSEISDVITRPSTRVHYPDIVTSFETVLSISPALSLASAISTPIEVKDVMKTEAPGSMNVNDHTTFEDMIKARYAILSELPLPKEVPDDVLKPILIPSQYTIHEFLNNASGPLRNMLSNYHVFQELTTSWCPDQEEHGYFLTPLFKCTTNPRVATAQCWKKVDPISKMHKPTECFYNREGKWYYAGVYKALRLEDLTLQEWENLSTETTQLLVKDTLSGRKNTSPANLYETTQLYNAGALKVACVGVQCVGFSQALYRAVLEHASKCAPNGRWRSGWGIGGGGAWNSNANTSVVTGDAPAHVDGEEENVGFKMDPTV